MNNISSGQMTVALLLSNAFLLMCVSSPLGLTGAAGIGIAFFLECLLCLPTLILYRKGFSFSAYCQQSHKWIPALFVLYLLIRGGLSFRLLWNSATKLSLPFSQPLLAAILIGLVCLYTASLGIRAFARAGTVLFGVFVATLLLLLLGAYPRMDLGQLATQSHALTETGSGIVQILSLGDTLPLFFLLMDVTRRKRSFQPLWFLLLSLILWELMLLLCKAVLGALLSEAQSPFFLLTAVSQPLRTQRADALFLIVFVLLCIVRLTLLTVLSAHLLGMLLPALRLRSLLSLGGMVGCAGIFTAMSFSGNAYCLIGIVLMGFLLPLMLCLRKHS
jgi:hypothetical protein